MPSFTSSRPFNVSPKIIGIGFSLSIRPIVSRTIASTSEKLPARKKPARAATANASG